MEMKKIMGEVRFECTETCRREQGETAHSFNALQRMGNYLFMKKKKEQKTIKKEYLENKDCPRELQIQ